MHLYLMQVLTFTTGLNDAVGYLGLDRVFTGNMTGNVAILGMALNGTAKLPLLGPALALGGFMVGAAVGGRVLRQTSDAWSGLSSCLFATVAGLMLLIGLALATVDHHPSHSAMVTATTTAALAMGLQAATARVVAVKDVTTVVVTSTITGLAADSFLGSRRPGGTLRRLSAVVVLLGGAAVGAVLLQLSKGAGLLLAGVAIALCAGVGEWHRRIIAGAQQTNDLHGQQSWTTREANPL